MRGLERQYLFGVNLGLYLFRKHYVLYGPFGRNDKCCAEGAHVFTAIH